MKNKVTYPDLLRQKKFTNDHTTMVRKRIMKNVKSVK